MALYLPPSVSVSRFVGGYKSISDYTDLSDTETNDSQNVLYSPKGDIQQRPGSERLYNTTVGGKIRGHNYFKKLGGDNAFHVVSSDDSLFNYTSSTASVILSTLNTASTTYFSFCQIQDPDDISDDLLVATNYQDDIAIWSGSGTATYLNAVAGAAGVPKCKYVVNFKNRIYAANINDATDVDSSVKVAVSSFGADGAPDPHIFRDEFYLGGATGEITGVASISNLVAFYTEGSIWKLNPGSGNALSTASLTKSEDAIGCIAPRSLVDVGGYHIFLSARGVYAFDGARTVHLSEKVDDELLSDSNRSALEYAVATFDKTNNQYVLYFPSSGSSKNNRCLIYDIREGMKLWQPPVTGREVSFISNYEVGGKDTLIYGDYLGYLFKDGTGSNDGVSTGVNDTVSTASADTLTADSATFSTTGDGLAGVPVTIISGTGEGQTRIIQSNTASVLTLSDQWSLIPDSTSRYTVGGICAYWRSKDYDFGGHDIVKLFRAIRTRVREEGNFNLTLTYIVDFKTLSRAATSLVNLLVSGMAWGVATWGASRWGRTQSIVKKTSLRSIGSQSTTGNHLALRYSNDNANESFRINGFDVEIKQIGKR